MVDDFLEVAINLWSHNLVGGTENEAKLDSRKLKAKLRMLRGRTAKTLQNPMVINQIKVHFSSLRSLECRTS